MATLDEIFAAMPEATAADDREYLVIDPAARTISVPDTQRLFGVTGDELADRKYFICPRYVGDGLDLAGMFLRVNYRNANGQEDGYLVNDLQIQGEYVTFSWQLTEKVTLYKGTIGFAVCADLPSTNGRKFPDWNTTTASGEVLEGLHPDLGDVEAETSDVVTQLRAEVSAQTAAVEATGAAQTKAVQNAAAAATAASQDQIQAKGTATLATIPADYTTLAGKVNNLANAIKGTAAGEILRLDDVSPVEHYPAVRVHGKNLWNMAVITSVDGKFTNNGDGSVTIAPNTYYATTGKRLRDICPELRVGDVVTLSMATDGCSFINLNEIKSVIDSGDYLTITEACLDSTVALYGTYASKEDYGRAHTISSIQLEMGTEATEYTPYVAPETVTLTRCGKNLLPYPFRSTTATIAGVTYTDNGDGSVTVSGTPTEYGSFTLYRGEPLARSGRVVFSGVGSVKNVLFTVHIKYGNGEEKALEYLSTLALNLDDYPNATLWEIGMKRRENNREMSGIAFPQIEAGEAATEYESYKPVASAMPAADGTVGGLTSLAPTMTLLTDTPGMIVECEYNRDTGKVIQRLEAAIAALGGTI